MNQENKELLKESNEEFEKFIEEQKRKEGTYLMAKLMAQYIDKSALVAEIERRGNICKKVVLDLRTEENKDYYQGKAEAYKETLDLLDTLEVKEAKNIWHIVSETDLPKVGEHICCIKNGNILSGEYKANKFYGKVCNGYDNPIEKGDKWCRLDDFLNVLEVKEVGLDLGSPDGDMGVKTVWDGDKIVSSKVQKGE